MNENEKQMIMRYAELTLKQDRQLKLRQEITQQEHEELGQIRLKLGLSHEEILDLAVKNLIPETG